MAQTDGRIRIHQCISGFLQSERRMHGVFKLAESLHERGYNNTISRVSLRPWTADWAEVAESIWLIGQRHEAPVVVNIYAYSWGVGWGAVRLCEELRNRHVKVQTLVSADGVFRHPNPLLRWQSLVRRDWDLAPVIRIPANVSCVIPFHQTINRPQGHRIIGAPRFSGVIRPSREIQATHQYIDDAEEFHNACFDAARNL